MELFRQGDPSQEVFHLEEGLVKLRRTQPDGEEVIVGLRSAGWFLGAGAAMLGKPYATTAVTATRCSIARLCVREFLRLVRTDHELSWQLHQMHSREVYEELVQIADLGSLSARQRLEHFFEQLLPALGAAGPHGEIRVELPLKHWEIAQLIAVTPVYLCQLLHEMEDRGVIRRERKGIVLVATAGLHGGAA